MIQGILTLENISIVLLWIVITSTGPFLFNMIDGHPHKILIAFSLVVMVILLVYKKIINCGDKIILIVLGIQIIYFLLLSIYYTEMWYLTNVILLSGIFIIYLFIYSIIGVQRVISSVLILMTVMGILGIIGFILAFTGILEPSVLYYRNDTEPVYSYIVTFTNTMLPLGSGQIIRVGGFFNEGGTLGFYLIHALILNKLIKDNKKIEILLIITGVFTFSFAFFISILFYVMFFYMKKRSILFLFGMLLVGIFIFAMVSYYKDDNSIAGNVYDLTFKRFELSDEGSGLKGNNRAIFIKEAINHFTDMPLLGHGIEYVMNNIPVSNATFMGPLVAYGILGASIYFLHVIYLCIMAIPIRPHPNNMILIKSIIILLLNYLQRPFVLSLFSYIVIILIAEGFRYKMQSIRRPEELQC